MFFWLGSDRSPCMGDTTSCWYINSKLYCHFQQYRWYICSPPTSITRLKLKLGRKPMHRLIAPCYTSRTNKISWGSYWFTLTSLWVMAHKAKVWYKGKLNKLCLWLRRPVPLCKLVILSPLMSSPLRAKIISAHSACIVEGELDVCHKQYSTQIPPAPCWSVTVFIDFSFSILWCTQAHHNESISPIPSLHSLQRVLSLC